MTNTHGKVKNHIQLLLHRHILQNLASFRHKAFPYHHHILAVLVKNVSLNLFEELVDPQPVQTVFEQKLRLRVRL